MKWIKELKNPTDKEESFALLFNLKPYQLEYLNRHQKITSLWVVGWIKHFFNITEEDLKQK